MTEKERLHQLIDQLPEKEVKLAIRILEAIDEAAHGVPSYTVENAPLDDEPFDRSDIDGGDDEPPIPHEEVLRHLIR